VVCLGFRAAGKSRRRRVEQFVYFVPVLKPCIRRAMIVTDRSPRQKRPVKPRPPQAIDCPIVVQTRRPGRYRRRVVEQVAEPAADERVAAFYAKMGLT
jgi:hypothetical protein